MTKRNHTYIGKSINTLILFSFIFFFGCTESLITQPDLRTSFEDEYEWTDLDTFGNQGGSTEGDPQDPCPPDQLCDGVPPGGGGDEGDPADGIGGGNGEDPQDPCPPDQLCDGDQTNEDTPG